MICLPPNIHTQIIEEKNINHRCKILESVINRSLQSINKRLFQQNKTDYTNFDYVHGKINAHKMKQYISYIYEWNGLTQASKIPTTYRKYQSKARNWLNGRRSKKYSNTLFVDMIQSVLNVEFYTYINIQS